MAPESSTWSQESNTIVQELKFKVLAFYRYHLSLYRPTKPRPRGWSRCWLCILYIVHSMSRCSHQSYDSPLSPLGRSYGGPRDRDRDPQSRFRFRFRFLVPTGESLIQIYDNVTIAWETGSYGQIFSDFASRSRSRFRFLAPTVTEIGQKPSSDLGVSKKISGNHLTSPKKGRNLGGSGGHRDWKRDPQSRFRFRFRFQSLR